MGSSKRVRWLIQIIRKCRRLVILAEHHFKPTSDSYSYTNSIIHYYIYNSTVVNNHVGSVLSRFDCEPHTVEINDHFSLFKADLSW